MDKHEDVIVTYGKEIVNIKFNRPRQLNALNENIRSVIASTLNELMERPDIRLLVFSGEGKSFCSGADLKTTSYPKVEGDWSTRRNRTATWQRLLEQLDRIPQVSITSIQGHVIGGGACWQPPVIPGHCPKYDLQNTRLRLDSQRWTDSVVPGSRLPSANGFDAQVFR